jgi:general secretion pathway protein G
MMRGRQLRARAFTLIELLVVMAVVAVLAGFVLSSLGSARESARRAKCASNLRQIALSMTVYAEDNHGHLPAYFYTKQPSGNKFKILTKPKWATSDLGELNTTAVLVCPSDRNPPQMQVKDANDNTLTVPCSYGFNFEADLLDKGIWDVKASQVILLFDGAPDNAQQGTWDADNSDVSRFNSRLAVRRHGGRMNIVFVDNHIECLADIPDAELPRTGV